MTWMDSTQDTYWEMLEILPPAAQLSNGFLIGEPADHRTCTVTGQTDQPRFEAFAERAGKYYRYSRPLTRAEFREAIKKLPYWEKP